MKHSLYISVALLVLLSGCSSREERAQIRAKQEITSCKERGLEEGTEAFDACRMQARAASKKREEERLDFNDHFRPDPVMNTVYGW